MNQQPIEVNIIYQTNVSINKDSTRKCLLQLANLITLSMAKTKF